MKSESLEGTHKARVPSRERKRRAWPRRLIRQGRGGGAGGGNFYRPRHAKIMKETIAFVSIMP